jgi:radical SAM protein with 4Fe4S-binding SPASM domain
MGTTFSFSLLPLSFISAIVKGKSNTLIFEGSSGQGGPLEPLTTVVVMQGGPNMQIPFNRPRFAVWELTLACNMRCLHCGSYAGATRVQELTLEDALYVADQLADLGCERITLSGGELLLRKDWDLIAERLLIRGVKVGLISNGYLMKDNIDKIKKLPPLDVVAMSLDGIKQTHDRFRRLEGSFDRVMEAFEALNAIGVRTAAVTSLTTWNLKELDEMHDIMASIGVYAWQLQLIFGGGRMKEHQELIPAPEEIENIARFIIRKKKASPMVVYPADGIGYYTELEEQIRGFNWPGCQAGLQVIGIEANGNVKGCLSLYPEAQEHNPFVEGNVRERTLREIWEDPNKFSYRRKFDYRKAKGVCRSCSHLKECRCGCTAQAFFSSSTIYENPYCMHAARMKKA